MSDRAPDQRLTSEIRSCLNWSDPCLNLSGMSVSDISEIFVISDAQLRIDPSYL